MIKRLNIKTLKITFVLRYRWEKKKSIYTEMTIWREWELGMWFKKQKIVSCKDYKHPTRWNSNLVNSYMIGINLLWIKLWVEFNNNGKLF